MYKGMRKCIHEIRESTGKQKSPLRKEKLTNIKYQIVQYASQVGEEGKGILLSAGNGKFVPIISQYSNPGEGGRVGEKA